MARKPESPKTAEFTCPPEWMEQLLRERAIRQMAWRIFERSARQAALRIIRRTDQPIDVEAGQ